MAEVSAKAPVLEVRWAADQDHSQLEGAERTRGQGLPRCMGRRLAEHFPIGRFMDDHRYRSKKGLPSPGFT